MKVRPWIKEKKYSILSVLFILLLCFIFSMQSPLNLWFDGNDGIDSSVFKYIGYMMTKGYMPYADMFDHKGPLIYILNWLGVKIAYWNGIWCIECIFLFITFLCIYKIARLCCNRGMSCLALFIASASLYGYYEDGNFVEEYAMMFIGVALYIFIDYFLNNKISHFRLILSGICFGAVCMLKVNMVSVWIVFSIAVLIKCIKEKAFTKIVEFLSHFLLGAGISILPIVIWLIKENAFVDFINNYLLFNMKYSGMERFADSLGGKYKAFSHFFNSPLVLVAVVILSYLCISKERIKDRFFNISYFVYFVATLLLLSIAGKTNAHYGMVLVPLLAYPVGMFMSMCEREWRKGNELISLFVVVYFLVNISIPKWIGGTDRLVQSYRVSEQDNRSGRLVEAAEIIEQNSEPDDEITVWGNCNALYLLSERKSASKYSYQYPIGNVDESILNEYFEEITEKQPKLVVLADHTEQIMLEFLENNKYTLVYEPEIGEFYNFWIYSRDESRE